MSTAAFVILVVLAYLFIADTTISFSPFSVKVESPLRAIGWFLIALGVASIQVQSHREGRKSMLIEIRQEIKELQDEFDQKQMEKNAADTTNEAANTSN